MKKEIATFLFLIDISGSMHGQKISSVNAALTESMEVLKNKKETYHREVKVGFLTFSDKMDSIIWCDQLVSPSFSVEPNEDGFYSITSYKCLYDGLYHFLISSDDLGDLYIILITDGKTTEKRREYDESFERANSLDSFRCANRYAAIVDLDIDKGLANNIADNDILEFLSGNDAKKRFKLVNLSKEISKMDFFEDNEKSKIASIFGKG